MNNNLKNQLDMMALSIHGITKNDAISMGLCINCKQIPTFYTDLGRKEYRISGMCEPCFDLIMRDPDDCCSVCELPREFHIHLRVVHHSFVVKPIVNSEE